MRFCCSGTDFIRGWVGDNLFRHYSYPRLVFYCCIIALRMGWCPICFLVKAALASGVLASPQGWRWGCESRAGRGGKGLPWWVGPLGRGDWSLARCALAPISGLREPLPPPTFLLHFPSLAVQLGDCPFPTSSPGSLLLLPTSFLSLANLFATPQPPSLALAHAILPTWNVTPPTNISHPPPRPLSCTVSHFWPPS